MRSFHGALVFSLGLAIGAPLMARPHISPSVSRPLTYGTSVVTYLRVPAPAFSPFDSIYPYSSPIGSGGSRWITAGCGGMCFFAPLQLPEGALLVYLELDFIDSSANDGFDVMGSLEECDNQGQNCVYHPLAGVGPPDCFAPGYMCSGYAFSDGAGVVSADLTPDNITVDNLSHTYILGGGNNGNDGTTQLAGMIVGYVLQVSPDPGFATFNDVPVGSPLHRYVEALFASGITAGCGNGNYCPNNPVTRGQMAVFLAKALGLQWQ